MIRTLFMVSLVLIVACNKQDDSSNTKSITPEVIYGEDNRQDIFELTDPLWKSIAQSTVALIDMKKVTDEGDHYKIKTTGYGRTYGLCPDENFYDQPISAFCSGSLIGPDIVLTAGHCMRNRYNCEAVRIVFNYSYQQEDQDPTIIKKENVALCKEIIHTERDKQTGIDFALIRLKKKISHITPLPLQVDSSIKLGQKLTIIGHPSGLPSKWADEAQVIHNKEDFYFVTTLDSYGGNSGSAVFNAETKKIEGLLVRGESDFVHDPQRDCLYSRICPQDAYDCRGEEVVRASVVMNYVTEDELLPLPPLMPSPLMTLPIVY